MLIFTDIIAYRADERQSVIEISAHMVYNYIHQMFGGKQMKNLVNGIHHVSLKCRKGQEYDKAVDFTAMCWDLKQPECGKTA